MELPRNKSSLLYLKEELAIVKDGKEILQQKRDILIKEIFSLLDRVEELRTQLNQSVLHSYNLLKKAYMESGKEKVLKEAQLSVFRGELTVKEKVFMGIVIPEVKFKLKKEKFPVMPVSERLFTDLARQSFFQTLEIILKVAQIEIKAWRLAQELKKTVIRVNALEKYYIPLYEKQLKSIQSSLEEAEREFLFLLKSIK
ncbi:V-type ATP synthase subunit D [Persephonella atlantica]|uniref:V-type ATP synthase subunit D n=1 Tax=Persephonella atlantica TaxID=2699429 RepID=A0ABS1GIC1_9AQUI|nr:V-type ATP synthase subunit D [Persephonella atlantica]MBK3332653.1 V-type ATP synthase subunit D [Persephonella atlantica]